MQVAVIIVGYRNPEDILRCLNALSRSEHREFEVILCENGGPDAFSQLKRALPRHLASGQKVCAVQAPRNVGYGGGVNIGMAESPRSDAWWILNPDTQPDSVALRALVTRLARRDCELVGGILYGADGRIQSAGGRWRPWLARAEALARGRPLSEAPSENEIQRRMNFVSGASMLVARRFLEVAGPMREDYFLYAEEIEWCLRGMQRGMRLGFTPAARVLHHQGTTTGSVAEIRRRPRLPIHLDERNKLLLTRDRFPARLPVAAAAALALLAARYARKGAWRQLGYALAGWRDGILQRRGPPSADQRPPA